MKRVPWLSGIALMIMLAWVTVLTRPVKATTPCFTDCTAAEFWASNYCYYIGCATPPFTWFYCSVDGSGVGGYGFSCACSCMGHPCAWGDSGTINPSCQNPCIPGYPCP